jgi:hypothetical protein
MFADKAPYIVTIIVAGLAWALTHVVDRLLGTPLLTYQTQITESSGKKSLYVTLKNITRDKTFRNVRVILTAATGDLITNAAVIPIQPAWEGDEPGTREGRTFDFKFSEMQPGSQFEISVTFGGIDQPTLRMSTDDTINFVRPSWETWIVENEISLLACLVVLGIIALLVATAVGSNAPQEQYDT